MTNVEAGMDLLVRSTSYERRPAHSALDAGPPHKGSVADIRKVDILQKYKNCARSPSIVHRPVCLADRLVEGERSVLTVEDIGCRNGPACCAASPIQPPQSQGHFVQPKLSATKLDIEFRV